MTEKKISRLMIINWKFEKEGEYSIQNDGNSKLICLNMSDPTNFYDLIKTDLENCDNALILLHKNAPNKNVKPDNCGVAKNEKFRIEPFGGGSGPVYYNNGGLLNANAKKLHKNCMDNDEINKDMFDFVWDWYWNILPVEEVKKKLINLWLPLAIDMQGLKEISEDPEKKRNAEAYFREIKDEYENEIKTKEEKENQKDKKKSKTAFLSSLKDEHAKVKVHLEEHAKDEVHLTETLKGFNPVDIVEAILDSHSYEDFMKKPDMKKADPNRFPDWFNKVTAILDEKIKAAESNGSKNEAQTQEKNGDENSPAE
jgi:hypothetical protein